MLYSEKKWQPRKRHNFGSTAGAASTNVAAATAFAVRGHCNDAGQTGTPVPSVQHRVLRARTVAKRNLTDAYADGSLRQHAHTTLPTLPQLQVPCIIGF